MPLEKAMPTKMNRATSLTGVSFAMLAGFWELRSETSGTLREKLANLFPVQKDRLPQEAPEAVREFFSNDQMSIPAQMIIVTARKQ